MTGEVPSPSEMINEPQVAADRNLFATFETLAGISDVQTSFSPPPGSLTSNLGDLTGFHGDLTSFHGDLTGTTDVSPKPDVLCVPEMCLFYASDPYNTSTDSTNSDKIGGRRYSTVGERRDSTAEKQQPRLTRQKERNQRLQELKVFFIVVFFSDTECFI